MIDLQIVQFTNGILYNQLPESKYEFILYFKV